MGRSNRETSRVKRRTISCILIQFLTVIALAEFLFGAILLRARLGYYSHAQGYAEFYDDLIMGGLVTIIVATMTCTNLNNEQIYYLDSSVLCLTMTLPAPTAYYKSVIVRIWQLTRTPLSTAPLPILIRTLLTSRTRSSQKHVCLLSQNLEGSTFSQQR